MRTAAILGQPLLQPQSSIPAFRRAPLSLRGARAPVLGRLGAEDAEQRRRPQMTASRRVDFLYIMLFLLYRGKNVECHTRTVLYVPS